MEITTTFEGLKLPDECQAQVQRWLDRGDGIAVYENLDLGHPMLGHRMWFSYGSPDAQFETPEPPERLPDGLGREVTGGINWRYQLVGIYRPDER